VSAMIAETVNKVAKMIARYRVVVCGRGIFVEAGDRGDFFSGFVVCRFVKADSEAEAVALVRRNLLVEWNSSFNQSRSAGVPRLTIELSAPVNSPFKKAESSCSYRFFVSEDEVSAHLKSAILASSGWF
jgi:hypothetical protein